MCFRAPTMRSYPPGTILLGQLYHQGLQLRIDWGVPWRLALPRAIELFRHQPAVPGEDGLGLDDGGHVSQGLPLELFPNLGQRLPLAVAQPYTTRDLLAEDTVFCDRICIANQQLLVHRARDVSQHVLRLRMSLLL